MNRIKSQKTVDRNEVVKFLADELKIAFIRDYCPNGLQVEGQYPNFIHCQWRNSQSGTHRSGNRNPKPIPFWSITGTSGEMKMPA